MAILKPPFPRLQRGHPLARGLVGAWEFWEGAGTILHDSSGFRNDGTLVNSPLWVPGQAGSALSFNGTNQYVDAGAVLSGIEDGAFTVSYWINRNSDTLYQRVITHYTDSNSYFQFRINGDSIGRPDFNISGNSGSANLGGGTVTKGAWAHIAVVWNGTSAFMYVNGAPVSLTNSAAMSAPGGNLTFGKKGGSTNYFSGLLDGIRIYNRALSDAEVMQMYVEG